jgi:hypothetical protein
MRTFLILLAAALLVAQAPPRLQSGYASLQPAALKADLAFLSSDALEGRRSLERGSEVAIQWIASEFAKAGLKPAAGDSFLQPVPVFEYSMDRGLTTLTLRSGAASDTFRAPDAVANTALDLAISGPLVFAGYGITAPELSYDDYAGIDAKGKIVLVFNHEPQENDESSVFNGKGNTRYLNNNAKLWNAHRHGAVALLTVPDPNHQGPQRGAAGRQRAGAARPTIPSEQLIDGAPPIPLFSLSARAAGALFAAAGKSASDVHAEINRRPSPASFDIPDARIELKTVASDRRRAQTFNVAGLIEGSDPALRAETIVFSGHFDHDGTGPQGTYHGADDNGSGTIGVVALARAYAANPEKPRRSLLFIVFAAEERGLLGSYYYASHPLRPLETTRAQINFDMIGRNEAADSRVVTDIAPDTSNELGLIGTHYSPDYREIVERHNRTVGLRLTYKWDFDAYNSILFRSDQYPLLLHDVPAVWWFTGFHPDYHQVTDTVEKINFEKMTKILKLAYLTGFEFADARSVPRFQPRAAAKR